MINVPCVTHDLFRRPPISRGERLVPGGKDIIIGYEGARMLLGEITKENRLVTCDQLKGPYRSDLVQIALKHEAETIEV